MLSKLKCFFFHNLSIFKNKHSALLEAHVKCNLNIMIVILLLSLLCLLKSIAAQRISCIVCAYFLGRLLFIFS